MKPDIVLRGRGWNVRRYRTSDADDLRRAISDRTIARMTAAVPYPYTLSDARYWIRRCRQQYRQSATHCHLAITVGDRVVGSIGTDRHGDQAEFGYWLSRAYRGRGMMTAVVKQFAVYQFKRWPVARVLAKTFPFNPASARVLEKAGFKKTAYELRTIRKHGRWLDTNVYTRWR